MEVPANHLGRISFLLACVGGFCDTVTFVAGDSIFSAHVTGNFIVFAAQVISGSNEDSWIKLLTFPVFVTAVMIGGWLAERSPAKYRILLVESILLVVGGAVALILPFLGIMAGMYFVVMVTVFALGLQNTFGRLFAKETFGPTTIMTGNVTQASLDLGNILRKGMNADATSRESFKKLSVTIGGFLAGCLLGALLGKTLGLAAIGIPGLVLLSYICRNAGQ
jgi:uncharacterized membrane protein YoaK (UPF0700 family)